MKTLKQTVGLHMFELCYLCVLAVLPFIVAKPVIGFTILFFLFLIGFAAAWKKLLFRKVSLQGKSVFITGCDSGFGHALAKRLGANGLTVFAGCLNPQGEGAEKLKALYPDHIVVIPLDVTSDESVNEAVKLIQGHSKFHGLWSLVNNAGILHVADVEFCSLATYQRVAEVNLFGTIRVTKKLVPVLRDQAGRIINVTSADVCYPSHSAHALSKAGATAFSNSLRLEMRKFDIKVITVEPGNFYGSTGFLNKSALSVIEEDVDKVYSEASRDVQTVYGREYLQRVHSAMSTLSSTSCNTLAPVIDALEEAIVSTKPSATYRVDGSKFLDIHNWLLRLRPMLPQSWIDMYVEKDLCAGLHKTTKTH